MIGMAPVRRRLTRVGFQPQIVHTHCNAHAEQAAYNLVNYGIQILVARLRTINLPVCIISQS